MESNAANSSKINEDSDTFVQIEANSTVECVQTRRLESVSGFGTRVNDIIYCPPQVKVDLQQKQSKSSETTVVYFGGDVQDYTENMEKQRDGKKYIEWNLESTALLLHIKFPRAHIAVIKPYRQLVRISKKRFYYFLLYPLKSLMNYLTFSCFENFVSCNDFGIPVHCPNHFAISHLERLLQNLKNRLSGIAELKEANNENICQQEHMETDCNDLVLIGFSKGCIVMNQLVGELHARNGEIEIQSDTPSFKTRIREMYWLDGGHSGGRNTWITNKHILKTLAKLQILVYVHVTPYQMEDERRPWIRKEERIFTDALTQYGATLQRVMHFRTNINEATSSNNVDISTHFDVLKVFTPDVIIK